jgi:hypothetical protein
MLTTLVLVVLLLRICQLYYSIYKLSNNADVFDNQSVYLRDMHTLALIAKSSKKIYKEHFLPVMFENKTETTFVILDGNCNSAIYKEIQEGVLNILKNKMIGLRITQNTTSNDKYICYENIKAEW